MKIGDLAYVTGVAASTIRYWEGRGLLCADRAVNRYREYTQQDVELVLKVKLFRELGTPIADIKLWCDQIIDEISLLKKQLQRLESDDREGSRLREMCEELLNGGDYSFAEEELKLLSLSEKGSEDWEANGLLLRVDISNSIISAQLISLSSGKPIRTYSIDYVVSIDQSNIDSMDAERRIFVSVSLVKKALESYQNIVAIGFTGQIHGIVCLESDGNIHSSLYSWLQQFGLQKNECSERVCGEVERISGIHTLTGDQLKE